MRCKHLAIFLQSFVLLIYSTFAPAQTDTQSSLYASMLQNQTGLIEKNEAQFQSVDAEQLGLKVGTPCPISSTPPVNWDNAPNSQKLPKVDTSSIVVGRSVKINGELFSEAGPITGKLQFFIYDDATSQLEGKSEPLDISGATSPYPFQIPIVFPKAGAGKLLFGCFDGQQVFPDFANSYSVADVTGGGGCAAIGQNSFDPSLLALLALAIAWRIRSTHRSRL
jgi:hypothetical protein